MTDLRQWLRYARQRNGCEVHIRVGAALVRREPKADSPPSANFSRSERRVQLT